MDIKIVCPYSIISEGNMKKLKYFLLLLILLPCTLLFSGCLNRTAYVTNIEKTQTLDNMDIYTVTYSNGTTSNFSVENGKDGTDGEDLKIQDIFNYLVELDPDLYTNDEGGFKQFLQDYLTISIDETSEKTAINKALLSTVSVYSEFSTYRNETSVGAGAGVVYEMGDEYSYIVTNYHVVYYVNSTTSNKIASNIYVYLYGSDVSITTSDNVLTSSVDFGGDAIKCEYIGGSMTYDIAVLRVSTSDLKEVNEHVRAVDIATNYEVGDTAIAIGNPEGDGVSVTKGIVSVDSEPLTMTGADDRTTITFRVMRIDTAVNGGNSGGGLFNSNGELIGIVNAKLMYASDGSPIDNMSYALPFNNITQVANKIIDNYETNNKATGVTKLVLGVTIECVNRQNIYNPLTGESTIYDESVITAISSNSLASSHGLEVGETFSAITINGERQDFSRYYDLENALISIRVGDNVQIYVKTENNVETMIDLGIITSDMLQSVI